MNKLLKKIISILFLFIIAFFIYPEQGKHYEGFFLGWWAAAIHGSCLIPNYILSLFSPDRLLKATSYSGAYNFWWWATAITTNIGLIISFFSLIILSFASFKSKNK